MDARELLPGLEDGAVDAAREAAIEGVCARLGSPREWLADDGFEHEIVGGAIDGERVAWVERRSQTRGGWEDVDYHLHMRAGAAPARAWVVDTYNPHFGCEVGHLRWWGEAVTMIYREKHHTIAAALGPSGPPRLRAIADAWAMRGEVVLHASEARGLVERTRLPGLERLAPMTAAAVSDQLSEGTCDPGPDLAGSPAALQRQIAARLPDLPEAHRELLVGALAYRFWDEWPPVVATYEAAYDDRRWNPPCWLPFYGYCASEAAAAGALLESMARVAARPAVESAREDALAELACRHVAARCRELVAACRAGHLPEGTSCYFWVDWSQAAFAGGQALFPPGMWAAWEALRPRARELRALGEGPRARRG